MAHKITSMPLAGVMEDGSLIQLEFQSDIGDKFTLDFDPEDFETFISRAVQLVTKARIQKLASGDHLKIQLVPVVAATAQAPVGGGKVLLLVRSSNNLPYHFSLRFQEAEQLLSELPDAIQSAKNQSSQSRH